MLAKYLWICKRARLKLAQFISYLVFLDALWDRALAAAVLDAFEVRPSRSTFEAAEAALLEVCLEFLNNNHLLMCIFY